jgi:hypothetical protein
MPDFPVIARLHGAITGKRKGQATLSSSSSNAFCTSLMNKKGGLTVAF